MKKTILVFAIALASGSAFAVNYGIPGTSGNNGVGGPPVINPGIGNGGAGGAGGNALQGQLQGQAQGQLQAQGQRQSQSAVGVGVGVGVAGAAAGASNVGNVSRQDVTVTDSGRMRYSGAYEVRSTGIAPDIIAQPTAPCRIGVAAGGGWIGGALSFGGSVEDEGCTRRENARVLAGLGKADSAVLLMCKDPEVASVLPECAAPATQPAGPQVSYNPDTRVTTVKQLNGFNH